MKSPDEFEQKNQIKRMHINRLRFVMLAWWKKRRAFYVNVQMPETHKSNEIHRPYEATKISIQGSTDDNSYGNYIPKQSITSADCSSSSSSDFFDVSSTRSTPIRPNPLIDGHKRIPQNLHLENPYIRARMLKPIRNTSLTTNMVKKVIDTSVSKDCFLSRPVPFTPRRTLSSASLQSMDSLTNSNCWDSIDEDEDSSYKGTSESKQTPTSLAVNGSADQYGELNEFFAQHIQFLRKQTQPQRIHEFRFIGNQR